MMKRLLFMLAFLVSFGFAAVGQESVDPNEEESQEQTPQGPLSKSVTLETAGTLASLLGDDIAKVTELIVSGPLNEEDFATMKNQMNILQELDMSGVTELPLVEYWVNDYQYSAFGIPYSALVNKQTLQHITFPSCMVVIGAEAFQGCNNLFGFDFPNDSENQPQLRFIMYGAFQNCSGLQTLDLSTCKSLQEIKGNAFAQCNNLRSVNLNSCSQLLSIGPSSFYECSSLQTVDLRNCEQLNMIGGDVFGWCRSLNTVNLDGCNNLTEIGSCAFYYCNQLNSFDFKQLPVLKTIGSSAFYNTFLSGKISFPKTIYQIGESAFARCYNITEVTFDEGCDLAVISSNTFGLCEALESVDFSNCSSLNTLNKEAFNGCRALRQITINNGFYKSVDGVLYVVDLATLMLYPSAKTGEAFTIPSSVQTIQSNAFPYNQNLKTITIPSSVKVIQPNAFNNGISTRIIMESATPIGLSSSIGLENSVIIVPEEGLEAYKSAAVWKDYKIVKAGTSDLVEITLDGTQSLSVVLANEGIDLDMISQLKITGTVKASDFETLRQMNNLTQLDLGDVALENNEVPNKAFSSNSILLENIILPTTTKSIGSYAFMFCNNLKHINLSDLSALEYIGFVFITIEQPKLIRNIRV